MSSSDVAAENEENKSRVLMFLQKMKSRDVDSWEEDKTI